MFASWMSTPPQASRSSWLFWTRTCRAEYTMLRTRFSNWCWVRGVFWEVPSICAMSSIELRRFGMPSLIWDKNSRPFLIDASSSSSRSTLLSWFISAPPSKICIKNMKTNVLSVKGKRHKCLLSIRRFVEVSQ